MPNSILICIRHEHYGIILGTNLAITCPLWSVGLPRKEKVCLTKPKHKDAFPQHTEMKPISGKQHMLTLHMESDSHGKRENSPPWKDPPWISPGTWEITRPRRARVRIQKKPMTRPLMRNQRSQAQLTLTKDNGHLSGHTGQGRWTRSLGVLIMLSSWGYSEWHYS